MTLEIEATYDNGVLKPDQPLPLTNGQRVKLAVQAPTGWAKASAGIFRWHGDHKDLETLLGSDNHPWAAGQ